MRQTTPSQKTVRDGDDGLLRASAQDDVKPDFPELFFDLVFVFALVQLSHSLTGHPDAIGFARAGVLFLALWWIWVQTALTTNLLDVGRKLVHFFLFGLMFGGLLMSVAIPEAFEGNGLFFAIAYVGMQATRTLFLLFAVRGADQVTRMTVIRSAVWLIVPGILWVNGGTVAPEMRLWLWLIAILIEYAGPVLNFYLPGLMGREAARGLDVSGGHFAERAALFVIICLGETILATGRTAAEKMDSVLTAPLLGLAFATTVLMWWVHFHDGQKQAARKAEATSDPQKTVEYLFIYGHFPIVAGIVLAAVGEEMSLEHSDATATLPATVAIAGGPALFLAGSALTKYLATRAVPLSHCAGVAVLSIVPFGPDMPYLMIQGAAACVLLTVAFWEYLAQRTALPDRV